MSHRLSISSPLSSPPSPSVTSPSVTPSLAQHALHRSDQEKHIAWLENKVYIAEEEAIDKYTKEKALRQALFKSEARVTQFKHDLLQREVALEKDRNEAEELRGKVEFLKREVGKAQRDFEQIVVERKEMDGERERMKSEVEMGRMREEVLRGRVRELEGIVEGLVIRGKGYVSASTVTEEGGGEGEEEDEDQDEEVEEDLSSRSDNEGQNLLQGQLLDTELEGRSIASSICPATPKMTTTCGGSFELTARHMLFDLRLNLTPAPHTTPGTFTPLGEIEISSSLVQHPSPGRCIIHLVTTSMCFECLGVWLDAEVWIWKVKVGGEEHMKNRGVERCKTLVDWKSKMCGECRDYVSLVGVYVREEEWKGLSG